MFPYRQDDLVHTHPQLFYGGGNNSLVCLVRHQPVNILLLQAGICQGFPDNLIHGLYGEFEYFIAAHPDKRISAGLRYAGRHLQVVAVTAVGM